MISILRIIAVLQPLLHWLIALSFSSVQRPVEISQWDSVRELFNPNPERNLYNLGGGGPDVSQSSIRPLWKSLTRFCQRQDLRVLNYGNMYGAPDARLLQK